MFRYDHIGQKIKLLAKIFFVSGAVAAVISGFFIMFLGNFMILLGLLIMAGGPFVAWGFSWMIYGFGVLVDKADTSDPKSIPQQTTPQSDRIKQIERLRLQGLITEEEYQRTLAKARKGGISYGKPAE